MWLAGQWLVAWGGFLNEGGMRSVVRDLVSWSTSLPPVAVDHDMGLRNSSHFWDSSMKWYTLVVTPFCITHPTEMWLPANLLISAIKIKCVVSVDPYCLLYGSRHVHLYCINHMQVCYIVQICVWVLLHCLTSILILCKRVDEMGVNLASYIARQWCCRDQWSCFLQWLCLACMTPPR